MKNVCVFLSSSDLAQVYVDAAQELGQALNDNGYNLVFGGSDKGLMSVLACSVQEAGGRVIGISVEMLNYCVMADLDEVVVASNLAERKRIMLEQADAVIVMVGGIGTLDELTELLELKKHDVKTMPMIILNTDNFYEGLKIQLNRMNQEGFIPHDLNELIHFTEYPKQAVDFLNQSLKN